MLHLRPSPIRVLQHAVFSFPGFNSYTRFLQSPLLGGIHRTALRPPSIRFGSLSAAVIGGVGAEYASFLFCAAELYPARFIDRLRSRYAVFFQCDFIILLDAVRYDKIRIPLLPGLPGLPLALGPVFATAVLCTLGFIIIDFLGFD